MRIAVWHNLPSGGGKRQLYEHVRGLLARGHYLEAWCPSSADVDFLPLGSLCRENVLSLAPLPAPARSRFARLLSPPAESMRAMGVLQRHCIQAAEVIGARNFDVLFANSCLFFRTPFLGRYLDIPKALYLGEPARELHEARPTLRWAMPASEYRGPVEKTKAAVRDLAVLRWSRLQAREERANAAAFDAILVNSHFSRETILRTFALDASVCYLGIDTQKFRDFGLQRERVAIGLGAFVRAKNIEFIIEAISLVPPPRPGLVWIGNAADPDYLDELRALAAARFVDFRPLVRVSERDLIGWLNRALFMLYAPRLEPFGLAPLEANACGLPVVAVAEGGVRETIVSRVNGIIVDAEPKAMADAIVRLLRKPERIERLRIKARQRVATHWSLDSALDRLERQLFRVAGCNRREDNN